MKSSPARWLLVLGVVVGVVGLATALLALGVVIGFRLNGPPAGSEVAVVTATPSPPPSPTETAVATPVPTQAPATAAPRAHFTVIEADWPNQTAQSCIYQPWACIAHGTFRNDGSGLGNAPVKFSGPSYGASCMTVIPLTRPGDAAEASCVINSGDLGLFMASHSPNHIPAPGVEITNP